MKKKKQIIKELLALIRLTEEMIYEKESMIIDNIRKEKYKREKKIRGFIKEKK